MNHKQTLDRIVAKYNSTDNTAYLLDDLLQLTAEVNKEVNEKNTPPVQIAAAAKNYLHRTLNRNEEDAISSGFPKFDKDLAGFLPGEFIIFGGRPGMGKTSLFMHFALEMAKNEKHVLYVSLDASIDILSIRLLSKLSGIPLHKIRSGDISDTEKAKLEQCIADIEKTGIYIDDKPTHIFSIKEKCRQLKEEGKLDVLMVDYLQLVGGSSRRNNNRELEVSMICKELKNIAKEFNICVLAASQLSRAVETRGGDKRPQLSDLRESGALEQDADKVVFLYRPAYYNINEDENGRSLANVMELIVAKNRSGALINSPLKTNDDLSSFEELTEIPPFVDRILKSRLMEDWDNGEDVPF